MHDFINAIGAADDCFYILERGDEAQKVRGAFRPLCARFQALNSIGFNVFYAINAYKAGAPHKSAEYVTGYRAHFADVDTPGAPAPALPPSITVESSPGKRQHLWLFRELVDVSSYPEWSAIQAWWVTQVPGADPVAKDPARIFRLPGFANPKYDSRPLARVITLSGPRYTPDDFRALAPPMQTLPPAPVISDDAVLPRFLTRLAAHKAPLPRSGARNPWVFRLSAWGVRDLGLPVELVAEHIAAKLSAEQGLAAYDYATVLGIARNAAAFARGAQRIVPVPRVKVMP